MADAADASTSQDLVLSSDSPSIDFGLIFERFPVRKRSGRVSHYLRGAAVILRLRAPTSTRKCVL